MEHNGHNEIPPEGGGVIHVCSCGWRSRKCFSSAIASCEGMDHRENADKGSGHQFSENKFS